jgi:hypothetical protein
MGSELQIDSACVRLVHFRMHVEAIVGKPLFEKTTEYCVRSTLDGKRYGSTSLRAIKLHHHFWVSTKQMESEAMPTPRPRFTILSFPSYLSCPTKPRPRPRPRPQSPMSAYATSVTVQRAPTLADECPWPRLRSPAKRPIDLDLVKWFEPGSCARRTAIDKTCHGPRMPGWTMRMGFRRKGFSSRLASSVKEAGLSLCLVSRCCLPWIWTWGKTPKSMRKLEVSVRSQTEARSGRERSRRKPAEHMTEV